MSTAEEDHQADEPSNGETAADGGDPASLSDARQAAQRGWSKLKSTTKSTASELRQKLDDNPRTTDTAQRAEAVTKQAKAKGSELAADTGEAAMGMLHRRVGLRPLVDELDTNLETALLVIAAQRERIERLERRLDELESRNDR